MSWCHADLVKQGNSSCLLYHDFCISLWIFWGLFLWNHAQRQIKESQQITESQNVETGQNLISHSNPFSLPSWARKSLGLRSLSWFGSPRVSSLPGTLPCRSLTRSQDADLVSGTWMNACWSLTCTSQSSPLYSFHSRVRCVSLTPGPHVPIPQMFVRDTG